ncbi:MAG: sigma-54 dependent transcriptional regulator [Bacteroidetes bacterium]|nr:sigma-54 dependent transcriptional regulator [Bacteroidota bacterium]
MDRAKFQKETGLVGRSEEMREIIDVILQVAPTDLSVLITGESGTGKEVVAKAIHRASRRSDRTIVSVNCGAIPEGLMESELFGHERGAFTSAVDMRKGYFEIADGGTIFLDEIGETPLATQVKLLRVLETGEFMRVGASVMRMSDVRIIAATNKTLEAEVQQKRFRADLYFRLRAVSLQLPPLRNRREDIPALVDHFVRDVTERNNLRFAGFTDDATELLMAYRWPGNVRELRNLIESVIVLEKGRRLNADDVQKYLQEIAPVIAERNLPVVTNKTVEQAERELIYRALLDLKGNIIELRDLFTTRMSAGHDVAVSGEHRNGNGAVTLDEMERRLIMDALDRHNGNRRMAAKDLNISERTLYRKIKDYGLQ